MVNPVGIATCALGLGLLLLCACVSEAGSISVRSQGGDASVADVASATDASSAPDSSGGPDAVAPDGATTDVAAPDTAGGSDAATGVDQFVPSGTPLEERLVVTALDVGEAVQAGVSNWRVWGSRSLGVAPVFTAPLSNGETLVGFTADGDLPRVARIGLADQLVIVYQLASARQLRGLAAEPDGHFGVLLWDDAGDAIFMHRYDPSGNELWVEELSNSSNVPDDFNIGDSRMAYGDGVYGAYYHVHSDTGHEGDTLKWVEAGNQSESTGWSWGCSHSMSNLLRFHPEDPGFVPVCVTDCYPGTSGSFQTESRGGIYLNHRTGPVLEVDAGCNGRVAGELGGLAPAPSAGWRMVFNAHQNPMEPGQGSYDPSTMNQDIGLVALSDNDNYGSVQWLTDTPDIDEADATIAPWNPSDASGEQYLVGWSEPGSPYVYMLARIDAAGAFIEGPTDISAQASWGRRDDPMREHVNDDVVWAWFDSAGSSQLSFARVRAGAP